MLSCAVNHELACLQCGDSLSPFEDAMYRSKCKPCWDRHEQEAVFKRLCERIVQVPDPAILTHAIAALSGICLKHKA